MFNFKSRVLGAALLLMPVIMPGANIPVVQGLNAITIPTLLSLNYSANNVFSTAQDGEIIFVWNGTAGSWDYYLSDLGLWTPVAPVFTPGQGIFYYAVAPQTFVANFQAPPRAIPPGSGSQVYLGANAALLEDRYYFQGSPTGESASYENIFGGSPPGDTTLFRFVPGSLSLELGSSSFRPYYYSHQAGVWSPETPLMNPLEPVFVVYPTLRLTFTRTGNTIHFTWPRRGGLESAPSPTGPWRPTATIGGTNALSVTPRPQDPPQFYRVTE